jgi:hypothetical protein
VIQARHVGDLRNAIERARARGQARKVARLEDRLLWMLQELWQGPERRARKAERRGLERLAASRRSPINEVVVFGEEEARRRQMMKLMLNSIYGKMPAC